MSYFKRIIHNCSEASLLALRNEEEKISLRHKFEMRFHLFFCKCCRNFKKQSNQIDQSLKAFFVNIDKQPTIKASEDFKSRMKEKLKQ